MLLGLLLVSKFILFNKMYAMRMVEYVEQFDSDSEDDDNIRRPRIIRDRANYFVAMDERDFFARFRM